MKKKELFDLSGVKKIAPDSTIGDRYYDVFTEFRNSLSKRVVVLTFDQFCEVASYVNPLKEQKVHDPKLDLSKMQPPIIDIVKNKTVGCGRAIVANAQGEKKIPVLILADKESQIDWFLDRKGLKQEKKD